MRVKIRGLVFVGFAAAVFAQSAMADNTTTDAKTVTSKLYVDNYAQEQAKRVKIGNGGGTNEFTSLEANNFPWTSNDDYPSMKVLKDVKDSLGTAANIGGANYTTRVDVTDGDNNVTGHNIVLDETKLTTNLTTDAGTIATGEASGATQAQQDAAVAARAKLATTGAVYDYAQDKSKLDAATATTVNNVTTYTSSISDQSANDEYPTSRNVYEFVTTQGGNFQPKVDEAAATTMYVGKYVPADGNTPASATWDKLTTGTYVANTSSTAGTYTLDVPAAKITSATSDFAASGDTRAKLATAGTVYDFVKAEGGNYQPKIDNGNANTIMIGYNTQTGEGSGATYSSDWKALQGTQYISVGIDNELSVAKIALDNNYIADTGGAIASADGTSTNSAYNSDLTTAAAVREYVTGLTGGLTIPAPGADCSLDAGGTTGISGSNDKACALVLAYWPAEGTSGQPGYVEAGVRLKWVPMAQTVSSGL